MARLLPEVKDPKTGRPLPYVGIEDLPRWIEAGRKVRVKVTKHLRQYGLRTTTGSHSSDDRAWPNEVGTVELSIRADDRGEQNGWWNYSIWFPRGRHMRPDKERLEDLAPVPTLSLGKVAEQDLRTIEAKVRALPEQTPGRAVLLYLLSSQRERLREQYVAALAAAGVGA